MSRSLHSGFFRNAARAPSTVALEVSGRQTSYGELAAYARDIAFELTRLGIGRNDRVAVLAGKGVELYAAVLGILAAGAAYVPLEPSYPAARRELILRHAEPKALLVGSSVQSDALTSTPACPKLRIDAMRAVGNREQVLPAILPTDLAYVLFTSGSTGVPKGVMITHGNASAFVDWAVDRFDLSQTDRLSGHSDLTFDLSVFDTFGAFNAGATLVPLTDAVARAAPGAFIRDNRISVWFSVPSVLSGMAMMKEIDAQFIGGLRWMIFCGEALRPDPVRSLVAAAPHVKLANLYGPTEATVACSAYLIDALPDRELPGVPIGWRTEGTEVFVWHESGRVARDGEVGEIYISGDQVGPGYFRNATETAARFVQDPRFPEIGARSFRTGDLAQVAPGGPVFRGRTDFQIKFRGWRIEIGEVEQAVAEIDGVVECAAALVARDGGDDRFAAFIRQSANLSRSDILRLLRERLPGHMVPTDVRLVDDFPRTLNGKIDRKRLKELF